MNIELEINLESAITAVALAISFSLFLYYYLYKFRRVVRYKFCNRCSSEALSATPDISVVVVVGDDIEYIEKGLPLLLTQKYEGNFNVIVVHDSPESDTSISMLDILAEENRNLYLTRIKRDSHFRHTPKLPITVGIKAAKYGNILLTNTSAYVTSDRWLSYMAPGFTSSGSIVIGTAHTPRLGGILNRFTRSIEITDSLLALSAAIDERPYSVQSTSNMGLTSELFFDCGGFREHLRYNAGIGDLFLQRIAPKSSSTSVIMHPKASMELRKEYHGLGSLYAERKFATHARRYYPSAVRLHMAMLPVVSLLFWLAATVLFLQGSLYVTIATAVVIAIRVAILATTAHKYRRRTGSRIPYITYILSDLFISIDYLLLSIIRRLKPNKSLWL